MPLIVQKKTITLERVEGSQCSCILLLLLVNMSFRFQAIEILKYNINLCAGKVLNNLTNYLIQIR